MIQNWCVTCPRAVPDVAYGCATCAAELAQLLDDLAAALPEIETTLVRQDRLTDGGPRATGAEQPLPFRADVDERGRAIQGELVTWAKHVGEETGRWPSSSTGSAVARHLAQATGWARYRQEWPEFYAALRPLLGSVLHLIDRPVPRVYVGPCGAEDPETGQVCGADVYARHGAAETVCRTCGTTYAVAECQAWMRDQLRDLLARPVEISGMLSRLGMNVTYRRIMKYADQRQLVVHGYDTRARELYRVGDVIDLWVRNTARIETREAAA